MTRYSDLWYNLVKLFCDTFISIDTPKHQIHTPLSPPHHQTTKEILVIRCVQWTFILTYSLSPPCYLFTLPLLVLSFLLLLLFFS